jgi:RNA polymerase sigma factor (sigma-70 family)
MWRNTAMGTERLNNVQLPTIGWREEGKASDGELLERFVVQRDEEAFANLVHRYGSLVLGVCQRVLGDTHQAEDAFQATFLVLVRRAGSLDGRGPLGNWLYAVAYRTATKARMTAARRRARERQAMDSTSEPYTVDDKAWDDMRPILDEELSRLPGKYRAPLVLCYLEGKTQQQAAQELGWPSGSMSRRMNRARQLLRDRLEKRGVATAVGIAALFWLLSHKATANVVSPGLLTATVKAVLNVDVSEAMVSRLVDLESLNEWSEIDGNELLFTQKSRSTQFAAELTRGARRKVGFLALFLILMFGLGSLVSAAWIYENRKAALSSNRSHEPQLESGAAPEANPVLEPAAPILTPCHGK